MNRVVLLAGAAAVVLVANGWVLLSSMQNRSGDAGGTFELTEGELRLPPVIGDSTALLLRLAWRVESAPAEHERTADWLNAAKLRELGFDCSVPVTSPGARQYYSVHRTKLVYVVLQRKDRAPSIGSEPERRMSLSVVDVGLDPQRLRAKYPDPKTSVIARGVVRLGFQDRSIPDAERLPQPRLSGWLDSLLVEEVFVPAPHNRPLQALRGRLGDERDDREHRFAATVSWGKRFEPWLRDVRLLPTAGSEKGPRNQASP